VLVSWLVDVYFIRSQFSVIITSDTFVEDAEIIRNNITVLQCKYLLLASFPSFLTDTFLVTFINYSEITVC
jgi:hypothetical protein